MLLFFKANHWKTFIANEEQSKCLPYFTLRLGLGSFFFIKKEKAAAIGQKQGAV